jgi:1-deoxy-D-xylulose-5-phosphate reductoisomerase
VAAFQSGNLPFLGIVDTVAQVVSELSDGTSAEALTLEQVLAAESWARTRSTELIEAAAAAAREVSSAWT